MGLTSLNAALSGLKIAQSQINIVSTNVANVGTPGYSRKILPQYAQSINGVTVGVLPGIITRNVDMTLSRDLWTQTSTIGAMNAQKGYLERVEQFHGPPDKELSFASEISRLKDVFAALTDSPEDTFLQNRVLVQAQDTALKINNFAELIDTLRNDAQTEISLTVDRINEILVQISQVNQQIRSNINLNRSAAQLQDERDAAIKELSGLLEISFFTRGDGVMVVQTNEGIELASDQYEQLTFDPNPLSATTFYPDSAAGIYVGDPDEEPTAIDITQRSPNGKLGGLITMRDVTFPKQMAQLDEMAHKLALRLEAQGLKLFTDSTGNIPLDTPPDPSAGPPATAVEYVGFAGQIQVNPNIVDDPSLIQQGTYGVTIPDGSDEVLRRVIEFGFGEIEYQLAEGDINLNVSTLGVPQTLQEFLGLSSENEVKGGRDLSSFASPAVLIASANGTLDPGSDTFRITFEEPDLGLGPINIDVSLAAVPDGAGSVAQDIVDYINTVVVPGLPAGDQADLVTMAAAFSVSSNGELVFTSNADISIDATVVANGMGDDGLVFLGLAEGTTEATDPYFDIQVGTGDPVRITIDPNDVETQLLAQLNAVYGLAVQDLTTSADGFLRLRPGNDYTNPDFGGDIRVIAGPFTASSAGANAVYGAGTIADGVNIVSALFGSFSTGPLQDLSPITDVEYQSETYAGSGVYVSFREEYLGPSVDISTSVSGAKRLIDFGQRSVNEQVQEMNALSSRIDDEESLHELLEKKLLDDSGVNLDEELSSLITLQTSYSAAARVIQAVENMFDQLLDALV
ncbi:MAG: flagellar hook-associated protein FlgK [Alphaproteobacteria bacterium]|nr:flagellar hook-associated protein FlgK [Alphaproteobacteria bacterium]